MSKLNSKVALVFVFILSAVSTFGSLYFSEIMYFTPCKLCWYQRIAMYPIVSISLIGLFFEAKKSALFILPLSLAGMGIAAFHSSLQHNLFGLTATSCSDSLCSITYINYFGFLTIPTMSFIGFSFINLVILFFFLLSKKLFTKTKN